MRRPLAAAAAVLLLGACSPDNTGNGEATESVAPETVTVELLVFSTDGNIGSNVDDSVCVFAHLAFELRDGAGTIVGAEELTSEGATYGDSPAVVANVVSTDPYRCEVTTGASVEVADFFDATVTAYNPWTDATVTGEVTFSLADAEAGPVEVELA